MSIRFIIFHRCGVYMYINEFFVEVIKFINKWKHCATWWCCLRVRKKCTSLSMLLLIFISSFFRILSARFLQISLRSRKLKPPNKKLINDYTKHKKVWHEIDLLNEIRCRQILHHFLPKKRAIKSPTHRPIFCFRSSNIMINPRINSSKEFLECVKFQLLKNRLFLFN